MNQSLNLSKDRFSHTNMILETKSKSYVSLFTVNKDLFNGYVPDLKTLL